MLRVHHYTDAQHCDPTGVFDTSGNKKDSIVLTGWVLDQILDPKKMELAYHKLVQTWPILSARLRIHNKKWVYEIPEQFSESTPQYVFKIRAVQGPISATYNYSKPSETISCTIKENPYELYSQNGPRSVGDYMKQDIPVSELQLTQFDDATLIGLTTPHVLCDGHGNKEIIYALARILRGEDVTPLQLGDPFEEFITKESVEPPPYWRVFSAWQVVVVIAHLLWDFMWTRDISNRDVFFPKLEVERIKTEAMADLKTEHGENPDVWVSSSDVLVAFCLKCIHPPTTSLTPLNVMYAANLRRYLSEALPKPYLHNGACIVVTPTLPISAISSMSLGALAYHIRKTVQAQTDMDAIKHWLQWRIVNGG
ncbi:hypothetical protein BU17DRAFT_69703 [Hysterangium stoloniferum]|nr:hypothetical protein BU17DRAFT_69703 [Hysterangium stoloniferum]